MISIITPVLNEEGYIKPFFSNLRALEGEFELILVDGGSTDGTLKEVESCRWDLGHRLTLLEGERGRAVQMNRGAMIAEGDVLLFLHVDCSLKKDSLKLIEREVYIGKTIGGGFKLAFSNSDLFLKSISVSGNLRAKLTGTFYGDSGIFLRKEVFKMLGGFDNISFMEDIELCRKAKRYGKLVQIDSYIITSPRRYLSKGRLRLTAIFILAVLLNIFGYRPGFLIKHIVDK